MDAITKLCPRCKQHVPLAGWTRSKVNADGLDGWCRKCHNEVQREGLRLVRKGILDDLGGKCLRCGFADWRALQIDHVHGGGNNCPFRSRSTSRQFYSYVRAHREDFQVLCANCNAIKRIENKEHGRSGRPRTRPPMTDAEYVPGPGLAPRLSAERVREIQGRIRAGERLRSLAKEYGVHESTVSRIKRKHTKET